MFAVVRCSVCGRDLPDDAPLGLCPACLFVTALDAESSDLEGELRSLQTEESSGAADRWPLGSVAPRGDLPSTEGMETGDFVPTGTDRPLESTRSGRGPSDTHAWNELAGSGPVPEVPGYQILGRLGQGGMGVVFRALQHRANRVVALKMIRGDAQVLPEQLERFRLEVQAAARLKHPNVVQVYEVGEAGGRPFFSLELLEGGTLKERLAASPMPPRRAAATLAPLARAADSAHEAGIIHRDLKPSNVLFDIHETPRITDFGLAKRLEDDEGQTQPGQVVGTPSYMSPEQALGERRALGPNTDIYALGAILYEMLTGRPPFRGATTSETIHLVVTQDPVAPSRLQPRVPRDLETICLKCLHKEPDNRYRTARELADDLDRFLAGEPIHARPTPAWERAAKWARRKPAAATIIAASTVLAVVLAAVAERTRAHRQIEARIQQRRDDDLRQAALSSLGETLSLKERGELDDARVQLTTLQTRLQERPRLAPLLQYVGNELEDVEARRAERSAREAKRTALEAERTRFASSLARFVVLRDEALFHDAGVDVFWLDPASGDIVRGPDRILQTRETSRKALEILADGHGEVGTVGPLPASAAPAQRDEVRSGCYLLLMVLSEAMAEPLPGEDSRTQAEKALTLLDRAGALRPPTVACHLRRAACFDRMGDAAQARRERAQAIALTPAEAFDHILLGRECSRQGDWDGARSHFEAAIGQRPELFLAHYLLAAAALSSTPPRAVEAFLELNHCLNENRSHGWLYQLRGLRAARWEERWRPWRSHAASRPPPPRPKHGTTGPRPTLPGRSSSASGRSFATRC
jgi:tetratricopeptide (TPR) repeat protein